MVQEIVINKCFGGFGVSIEAVEWMRENDYPVGDEFVLPGEEYNDGSVNSPSIKTVGGGWKVGRDAEGLVKAVKELGANANGKYAQLEVVEIPDGVGWAIDEYDGQESIEEKHRSWG